MSRVIIYYYPELYKKVTKGKIQQDCLQPPQGFYWQIPYLLIPTNLTAPKNMCLQYTHRGLRQHEDSDS